MLISCVLKLRYLHTIRLSGPHHDEADQRKYNGDPPLRNVGIVDVSCRLYSGEQLGKATDYWISRARGLEGASLHLR